jgi:hypothetical protein
VGLPSLRAAPPKAVWRDMIKASARKRAKTTRERAQTPIMMPGQGHNGPSEAMISERLGGRRDRCEKHLKVADATGLCFSG